MSSKTIPQFEIEQLLPYPFVLGWITMREHTANAGKIMLDKKTGA